MSHLVGGQRVGEVPRAVEDGPPDEGGEQELVLIAQRGEDRLACTPGVSRDSQASHLVWTGLTDFETIN